MFFSKRKVGELDEKELSGFKDSDLSFEVGRDSISIFDRRKNSKTILTIKENGWKKEISGTAFEGQTIWIGAVGKKPWHRPLKNMFRSKGRSSDRAIKINGRNLGILEKCRGSRERFFDRSSPHHHKTGTWETYYYEKTSWNVHIHCNGEMFAYAKYHNGTYQLLIKELRYSLICLALAIASIDTVDCEYLCSFPEGTTWLRD